jgi:hypothetical protein
MELAEGLPMGFKLELSKRVFHKCKLLVLLMISPTEDKSKCLIKSKSQQNQNQKNQSLEFTVFSFYCIRNIVENLNSYRVRRENKNN